ncbi:MAG: rhodanese-like domain-containing protein, partial [Acidimicrobiales bacterium]
HILSDAQLPADKGSEVLLYCMSGRMSETAGNALLEEGYTNVSHLEGGMRAWEAAGKPLIQKPQESTSAGH